VKLRYEAGLVSFFEVIDSQRQQLLEQRALSQTREARQQATVQLIQALGGGWK
jgi:multidrug efflux system outer membrane protein